MANISKTLPRKQRFYAVWTCRGLVGLLVGLVSVCYRKDVPSLIRALQYLQELKDCGIC
jgi:hypothetical protein